MKAFILKLTLFVAIVSLLTACGSGDDNATGSENQDGDDVSISLMHYYNKELGEPAPTAQLEKLDEFAANNPDVTINQEIQSHDNYETKVKTLAAGDELPDVFLIKGSMTQQFLENEQVMNLDDFLNENDGWQDQFVDGTLTPFQVDGSAYGVPISGGATHIIYYNQAIFDEVGIEEFPATWDEFLEVIDTLNENDVTPIALGNKGKWVLNSSYLSTLGNRYTGDEWFNNILANNGEAAFTDQPFIDALGAINQLADRGAFNENMNSIDNSEQQAMYMNGKAAMFIEGDWAAGSISSNAPEDVLENTHVAIFPAIDDAGGNQNTVSGGGGWAYAINADVTGEKLEAIKDMIYHLTNEDAGKLILEKGQMPAIKVSGTEDMDLGRLTREILELLEDNKYVPIYDTILEPALIEEMNNNMQIMVIDQVTPEEAAENIQKVYSK